MSVVIGAISGAIGGHGANVSKVRGVTKTSKTILKTAVSAKKRAMYSAKNQTGKKAIIVGVWRISAAGVSGNVLNHGRKWLTSSGV